MTDDILPEGRHIAGPDAADKIDEAQRKYRKSEKGKAAYARCQGSEKGKATKRKYFQSEKGKEAQQRWVDSEKGQVYYNDREFKRRVLTITAKLQIENPDWSLDKCIKEAEEQVVKSWRYK